MAYLIVGMFINKKAGVVAGANFKRRDFGEKNVEDMNFGELNPIIWRDNTNTHIACRVYRINKS